MLAGIVAIGILPPVLLYRLRKPHWRADARPAAAG
jgi:hypothetical protein